MGKAFNLKNGLILLSTEAPGGLYNASQLKKIAAICDSNAAIVKATEDQRLALFVKEADSTKIAQELKAVGLGIRHYQDGLHQPIACVGELCQDHEQDALGSAMTLTKTLADITVDTPLKIGINGCASCCVPCHTLDVSILGDSSGYRLSLGGKTSQLPEMASYMAEGIPADKLPGLVRNVVLLYKQNAEAGETLQNVIERCGAGDFIRALAPYSQDAAGADSLDVGGDELALSEVGDEELVASLPEDDMALENLGDELNAIPEEIHEETDELPDSLALADDTDLLGDEGLAADLREDTPAPTEEPLITDSLGDMGDGDIDVTLENEELSALAEAPEIGPLEDDMLMEDVAIADTPVTKPAVAAKPTPAAPAKPPVAPAPSLDELEVEDDDAFAAELEEGIEQDSQFRKQMANDENEAEREVALDMIEESINQAPEEPVATMHKPSPAKSSPASKNSSASSTGVASVDVIDGRLVLQFGHGANMSIDPSKIQGGHKLLKVAGQDVEIAVTDEGFIVTIDGIEMFYPHASAAA